MIKIKNIEEIVQNSEVLYNEPLRKYTQMNRWNFHIDIL